MKVLDQEVDEAADLRRKMVAMRVDGVDGVLGLQKFGQDRNETTRFDLIDEQKARRQREPLACTAASRSALSLLACRFPTTATDCSPSGPANRHSLPHPEWE